MLIGMGVDVCLVLKGGGFVKTTVSKNAGWTCECVCGWGGGEGERGQVGGGEGRGGGE